MGAGTGPLGDKTAKYFVTLTFDDGQISKNDPIYEHFKSALDWLLDGLASTGGTGKARPQIDADGNVTSIEVEVHGPLPDPKNFNRAFNRLLWGVKFRKSPNPPTPSDHRVVASPQTWQNENT